MGRPTKLTVELSERIVKAIRAGNYADAAARAAGIVPSTYYRWLERGEGEDSGIYRDLHDQVRRAEGEAEVHAVAILRRAMPDDWRAAVAYLERRYGGRWRRHQATELTGKDGGPIRTEELAASPELQSLSEKDLRRLEEILGRADTQPD